MVKFSKLIKKLKKKKLKISFAESCTGGLLAQSITSIIGASKVFNLSVVTYSNNSKSSILNVTKKIIKALVRIKMGYQKQLVLGNLDSKRDWGHARDYVEAMWKILQQKKPSDYVIATGKQHSIRQFINLVAKNLI